MQIVTDTLQPRSVPEPAAARLDARLARVLQLVWLLLQIGALGLAVVATPLLHALLQTITPNQLGEISLAQPNAATAAALVRLGVPLSAYATMMVAIEWLFLLLWLALGTVIVGKRSRDPVGVALAFMAAPLGSSIFVRVLRDSYPDLWPVFLVNDFGLTIAPVLFFSLFPDGRWVPRWTRWMAVLLIGSVVVATIVSVAIGNTSLADLSLPVGLIVWPIILGAQSYRYRHCSSLVQRQQTKWLLIGMAMFVLNVVVAITFLLSGLAASYQWLNFVLCYGAGFAMIVAFGFAVLRYQLFDVDLVINRTLAYSALTLCLVGLYALIVGGLGALFQAQGDRAIGFVATITIALVFHPLRQRLQGAVDRMLYGERSDPYHVIARLGQRLEATFAPSEVLHTLVQTVSETLNLPYVALTLGQDKAAPVAAATGIRGPHDSHFPLTYQGVLVGYLLVSPRRGEAQLAPRDTRLLTDLAQQAGVAVHGVHVMEDLQRTLADLKGTREQLVLAREEERRRLRRDLHDDLAPTLAGLAITAGTIHTLIPSDPSKATLLVREQQIAIREAVSNIRRLVYDLRPPTLDDLGLLAAIRERAAQYSTSEMTIRVEAPAVLPSLPAAIEVAVYRIVQEALMNVVRHAQAHQCTIRLTRADTLVVEVTDDGKGLSNEHSVGIGLRSIRERAIELGGTCSIERLPTQGTRLMVRLPLDREAGDEQRSRPDR